MVSYPEDGLVLTEPVKISGEFINAGELVVFRGKVKTTVRLSCDHCLKDFDYPLGFNFEEQYSRDPKRRMEETDDIIFAIEPDNTIDLSEVVRQNILTELPIQALCDKSCPGPEDKDKEAQ